MSELGVQGLRAERQTAIEVFESLDEGEWNAPSDCDGWSVRDVVAHLASVVHGVVDPAFMADISGGAEQAMEKPVAERRAWTTEQVLDEYETYSAQLADAAAAFQDPPLAETMLPMADLGTHPMAIMSNMMLFDVYCHLRNDILQPNGPIDRPEPPRDETRLRPIVEWMLAGMPWMSADGLRGVLDRPLQLELTGPGGGSFTIAPADAESDGRVRVIEGVAADAAATVTSAAHDFVVWGTRRRPWRDFVKVDGDDAYAARARRGDHLLMSQLGLEGLHAERDSMVDVLRGLRADEWDAPSTEAGLRVRDVVAHVASTHHGVIDRAHLPGNGDPVAVRREWPTADLVDEFAEYTDQTINVFAGMQNGSGKREIPMGTFGTHAAAQLADLYLFDMYGHLRGDILGPFGPVDRPEPARDEPRVRPTVEWMIEAWPQMCPVEGAITITLHGTAGGTWTIGHGAAPAIVESGDHEFVLWGTQRRPWRDYVTIEGDDAYAARVLDTVRII